MKHTLESLRADAHADNATLDAYLQDWLRRKNAVEYQQLLDHAESLRQQLDAVTVARETLAKSLKEECDLTKRYLKCVCSIAAVEHGKVEQAVSRADRMLRFIEEKGLMTEYIAFVPDQDVPF